MFDDFVPWWQRHSPDKEMGGYFCRLDRRGRPYSTDKDMWMLGRQIWMFAHLYNTHEPRTKWLEIARLGAEFILDYGFKEDGKMYFRLARNGSPLADVLSVYSKVFAAIAFAEFGYAANDEKCTQRASALYDELMEVLGKPSDTPLLGYPMRAEYHLHSHDMCKLTVARVFDDLWPSQRYQDDSRKAANSIVQRHWKPERGALLENVGPAGEELWKLPEGRLTNPGHALESAWMILEHAERTQDQATLDVAIEIILASLEIGWDQEMGGVRYLLNVDGSPCHNIEADCKLWWPHAEALYATLLGWKLTGRPELARWYERVHQYTFAHFPDEEHGEWYGYLNRDGSPIWTAKANGWKGCFHTPRILYRVYQLLDRHVDDANHE